MRVHRRRRATQYAAAIPMRPPGSGGVGPSASLPRLDDAPASDIVAAPRIRPHDVRNATRPNTRTGSLVFVALFALAMAYLEAAVVVYLRRIYGITDLVRDVAAYDPALAAIEVGREAATLVMLLAVGLAAGRSAQARLGFAFFAFGLWDILYYAWLRVFIGWPRTLLDQDLLFLVPLPWWGPVLSPLLIALLSIAAGWLAVARDDRGLGLDPGRSGWAALGVGVPAALYAFMADALRALPASADALSRLRPSPFPWPVYSAGLLLMAFALWRAACFTPRHRAR